MIRLIQSFTCALFFIIFLKIEVFSMGSKQLIPMKTYPSTDIPDGEFLRYSIYAGGEKNSDLYLVTKRVTDGKGGFYYRAYLNILSVSESKKPPENYTNWPVYYLIDPVSGSTIESEGHYDKKLRKDSAVASAFGMGNVVSYEYHLYRDKGYVEYKSKSVNGEVTNESKYQVKVNPDFPSGNTMDVMFYSPRLLDIRRRRHNIYDNAGIHERTHDRDS